MKRWVGLTRWVRSIAPSGILFEPVTDLGLVLFVVSVMVIGPFRWKWAGFVLFGVPLDLPINLLREENRIMNDLRETAKLVDFAKWLKAKTPTLKRLSTTLNMGEKWEKKKGIRVLVGKDGRLPLLAILKHPGQRRGDFLWRRGV